LFATVATEQEAKEKEVELKAELIRRARETVPTVLTQIPPPATQIQESWTLGEAIAKTFEVRWNGTKSEQFYRRKCKVLSEVIGNDTRLDTLKKAALDDIKAKLRERNWSEQTLNHHLVALSMVCKIAFEREGMSFQPIVGIKKARRSRIRWLTEDEELLLLSLFTQWKKPDLVDWTAVLVDTGMRPSESKAMDGSWCDFRADAVHVKESKTPKGIRLIPMTKRVKAILERRCLVHPKGKLFPYGWNVYQRQFQDARKAMGLQGDEDFVPYALRHTFGSRLVQRGEDLAVIADLMGHEDLSQTRAYAKLASVQYVNAIRKLEKETPA
jgi:integrase